jgi:riboflavin synthase
MFTGIIEAIGTVKKIEPNGTNVHFWIESPFFHELKIDQSVAHDGVCLTIDATEGDNYRVTAIKETLEKTNLNHWKINKKVNLERGMILGARLDGHLVQGHVDCTGTCLYVKEEGGSWLYTIEFPENFNRLIIEKGSICMNGTSLTAFNITDKTFSVAIIPYTYNYTNINELTPNTVVNLEFDLVGKYMLNLK